MGALLSSDDVGYLKEVKLMEIIATILTIIISMGTIGSFIVRRIDKMIETKLNEKLQPIENSIFETKVNDSKNYLVSFLADVENGKDLTTEEIERAYEVYDCYTNKLHQNSYVHDKWQNLMRGGHYEKQIDK